MRENHSICKKGPLAFDGQLSSNLLEFEKIKYTMQTLLDDLVIIELYQQPGRAHHLSEITKKQMALYDAMGVPFPK